MALETNAELLLIDERRGREEATRLGLRITGLLGVLLEAKHRSLLPALRPILEALISLASFRISPALQARVLSLAGETEPSSLQ